MKVWKSTRRQYQWLQVQGNKSFFSLILFPVLLCHQNTCYNFFLMSWFCYCLGLQQLFCNHKNGACQGELIFCLTTDYLSFLHCISVYLLRHRYISHLSYAGLLLDLDCPILFLSVHKDERTSQWPLQPCPEVLPGHNWEIIPSSAIQWRFHVIHFWATCFVLSLGRLVRVSGSSEIWFISGTMKWFINIKHSGKPCDYHLYDQMR